MSRRLFPILALALAAALPLMLVARRPDPPSIQREGLASASARIQELLASAAALEPGQDDEPGARPRSLAEEGEQEATSMELFPGEEAPSEPEPAPLPDAWKGPAGGASVARARVARARCEAFARFGVREVHQGDDFDIVHDPPARAAMRACKEALVAAVEARAQEAAVLAGDGPLPPRQLETFFSRPFRDASFPVGPSEDGVWRDELVSLKIRSVQAGIPLLGVVVHLAGTGGGDDVLVIFEHQRRQLRPSMVVASHDYSSITEGYLALDFQARAEGGGYHVMTVHSSPWISSAWRGAHFQIFAPGPTPAQPRRLLEEYNSARIGEAGAELSVVPGGFRAYFASWTALSDLFPDVVRTHVHAFSFDGSAYRRVAPFVHRPMELPDEWLRMPWKQAQELTAPSARATLEPIHARLAKESKEPGLRGQFFVKETDRGLRLRLAPRGGSPAVRFLIEGKGDEARIAGVELEEPEAR